MEKNNKYFNEALGGLFWGNVLIYGVLEWMQRSSSIIAGIILICLLIQIISSVRSLHKHWQIHKYAEDEFEWTPSNIGWCILILMFGNYMLTGYSESDLMSMIFGFSVVAICVTKLLTKPVK